MKSLAFIFLLALISCGDAPKSTDGLNGTVSNQEIALTVEDRERVQFICDALASKEEILSDLLRNKYTFSYSEKKCGSSEAQMKDVATTIERDGGDYVFEKADGSLFGFPDVETREAGIMAQVCKSLKDQWGNYKIVKLPLHTSSTGRMWFTTFMSSNDCQSDANGLCILIQKGTAVNEDVSRIHRKEWIKFDLNNQRRGFFTDRLLVSTAGCKEGESFEKKAKLK